MATGDARSTLLMNGKVSTSSRSSPLRTRCRRCDFARPALDHFGREDFAHRFARRALEAAKQKLSSPSAKFKRVLRHDRDTGRDDCTEIDVVETDLGNLIA